MGKYIENQSCPHCNMTTLTIVNDDSYCIGCGYDSRGLDTHSKHYDMGKLKAKESALDVQVGGGHYKDLPIQPIEYTHKNNLNFCQGNIIKYVTRYKHKNEKQDLEKAKHYIDLLIQLEGY